MMRFNEYSSPTHFNDALSRARALDALAEAERARQLNGGGRSGTGLRRSVGLSLIHLGLRLVPETPIRGPSAAACD